MSTWGVNKMGRVVDATHTDKFSAVLRNRTATMPLFAWPA